MKKLDTCYESDAQEEIFDGQMVLPFPPCKFKELNADRNKWNAYVRKYFHKATCFTSEGMPYEKIMWVSYNSIDDINMVDGGNASNVAAVEDEKASRHFGNTDGDIPLQWELIPVIVRKPSEELICNYFDSMIALASRKLTFDDLRVMYRHEDIDGISEHEEMILRGVYGVHEKAWRYQRQFFEFVCRPKYNVEKDAVIQAANIVIEAMRRAGEDEETIRRYRKTFINPQMKRFCQH